MTGPADGYVLRCDGLRKSYGQRTAVKGVGFHISPGESYGLLGPNGAGKTTTISIVCGLLERDAGEVTVDGKRLDLGTTKAKATIGYVPPRPRDLSRSDGPREPHLLRSPVRIGRQGTG